MDITELRVPPVLPQEYFEAYAALEASVTRQPIVRRPRNLASLHALLALEILAHDLRSLGEREI